MACYIVYFTDGAKIIHGRKPRQEDHPGSRFAEGPFKNVGRAEDRIRWMDTKRKRG